MKFTVLKEEGRARRAVFETVHGTVQTPAFMNECGNRCRHQRRTFNS